MIMAHEIQGILALKNSFNKVGLDHVVLVKVASTAVGYQTYGRQQEIRLWMLLVMLGLMAKV